MSELYTSSRLKVLRECLRKHLYKYVLMIRLPETEVMAFGSVGHRALEAWYRAWKEHAGHEQLGELRLAAAMKVIDTCGLGLFDRIKLKALIDAYEIKWGAMNWEIIDVEIEFRYLLDEYLIGGKIDVLIRDLEDRRVYVVEHKTTGLDTSYGSAYWSKLAIDTQVSIYIDGATMLGYKIAGCVYDVLKRPQHEQLLATPEDKRKFTVGKGCKKCGGSAKAGEVVQGRGFYTVVMTTVEEIKCPDCDGTGWKIDTKTGNPDAPRLHSNMRDKDETVEDFEARIYAAIAENPENFLMRGDVVRLDNELPRMREDLVEQIRIERMTTEAGIAPRNPEACSRYGRLCEFFDACAGRESIDNQLRFPRGDTAHPELGAAA